MEDMDQISERTRPAHTLNADNPLLEALTELLPVCLFAKDLEGRYVYVNDSFAAKTPLKDKYAIIGKMPAEVLKPEHAEIAQKEDREVLETGRPIVNRENTIRGIVNTKNCEIISKVCVRDKDGNKLGIAGITLDITERKQNETMLARLNEQLDAQNRRYEEELNLGRQVQKAFLKVKQSEGGSELDVGYYFQPSEKLSGDLIVTEPLDDECWSILICDVMGHGIRSALVTGILRGFYDEHRARLHDPADFVTRLNKHYISLLQTLEAPLFTTLTCGTLNHKTGETKLTCAGHHDPIWFRSKDRKVVSRDEVILARNPAIGLLKDMQFTASTHTLEEGDAMLFFTDGLIEATSAAGEEFGEEPIRKLITETAASQSSQAIVDGLVYKVRDFAEEIDDDVSLLLLRR